MTSLPVRLAAATLAGVAAAMAFEPLALAPLAVLAVAALTLAVHGRGARTGLLLGLAFGASFMLVLLPWLQVIEPLAWVALSLLEALFYGLGGLATALVLRLRAWPPAVAAVWVALELLRSSVPFGGFPWGRLGFAVIDTPLSPAVAYLGVPGTTFVVALLGATAAWAVLRVWAAPVRTAAGVSAALALALLPALVPWDPAPPGAEGLRVRVAAVQGDVPGVGLDAFSERRAVLDNHVEATEDLAGRVAAGRAPQPDLVVWPENSSDIDPFADPSARNAVAGAARAVGVPLLMGTAVGERSADSRGWRNQAIVWSAAGQPGEAYSKVKGVPFGEYVPLRSLLAPYVPALDQIPTDLLPGDEPGVLAVGPAAAGVLMCFEVAYDDMVAGVVDRGADVIVVPTNNASYTGTSEIEQQFAMSRIRALESGRYVVVASTNGISGVVAPDGTVVARAPERVRAVLSLDVSLLTGRTPAVRLGGWVSGTLSAAAGLSVLAGALLGYRRRSHGDHTRVADTTGTGRT